MRGLRLQLIGILLMVALIPPIPAALTVHALFNRSVAAGLEDRVARGARAGLDSVRERLELEKRIFVTDLAAGAAFDTLTADRIEALPVEDRKALASLPAGAPPVDPAPGLRLIAGPSRLRIEGRDFLAARTAGNRDGTWLLRPLPETLSRQAAELTETVQWVETLRRDRSALVRGLLATFLAVYGVFLALIVALGMLFSSRLTSPLDELGRGIDRVAAGDWSTRVDASAHGRLGRLLEQFNQMTTDLEHQRDEVVRLERLAAWRNFARRLAHEIKNPLTPIRLAAQQVRDTYEGEDRSYGAVLEEGTAIIEEEVKALGDLVRSFSEFARLPEPQPRPVRLADLFSDLETLLGNGVVCETEPELVASCDRDDIHRVLLNLVQNGMHAQRETGADEPVRVFARSETDRVRIDVVDRGPGVPPEQRRRIFAPDFTTKSDGMGLGLAIVEETIRAHGGTIAVTDAGETISGNTGARFTFTLPAAKPESS